ncbi:hypothetical protein BGZ99_000768, partial [Dissophora globulifera]
SNGMSRSKLPRTRSRSSRSGRPRLTPRLTRCADRGMRASARSWARSVPSFRNLLTRFAASA